MENQNINIFNVVEKVQVKEVKQEFKVPVSFGQKIASFGKRALFLTSVPFYWLVFFTKILNFFDMKFFIFVVAASMVLSLLGKNWGILHFLVK